MSSLAEQLAQAEQRYTQAKAAVVAAEAKLAELKRAASSSNFQPLDTPANQEAFRAARARVTEFQNGELAELQLAEGAAFRAERDLKQQIQQEQQKTAADTATRAAADQGPKTDSSGTITNQANQARDSGANTQNPPLPPAQQTAEGTVEPAGNAVPTNAQAPVTNPLRIEITTTNPEEEPNDDVKGVTNTQSTPPITAAPGPAQPNGPGGAGTGGAVAGASPNTVASDDAGTGYTYYGATPGVGAASDDNTPPNANATRQAINDKFNTPITPRPNVLDQYASYTYGISIYIMSPADYARLLDDKKKVIPANQLLIQSGGAPTAGRNPYFGLDYYIDSVKIKSVVALKGTRGPHNVTEMEFRITEPNGISLLPNLFRATQEYVAKSASGKSKKPLNYASQNFLMVIRFYGYDDNGKLIPAQEADPAGATDSNAVVEKFIPFQFTSIKFRIANRVTEYECRAVAPQNVIATGQGRGILPYNVQLTATTIKDLLTSSAEIQAPASAATAANQTDAETARLNRQAGAAPQKADAAPQAGTLIKGLADALNKYQRELKAKGIYDTADEYEFVISDPQIASAKVRPPGQTNLRNVAQPKPETAADAKVGAKQSVDNDSKSFMVTAGTSIIQFLDQVMRNSTYIFDQQSWIYDPKRNVLIPQGVPANAFAWYRIGVQAKPKISDGYDDKRNDFAYKITYSINIYKVNAVNSPYFPNGKFQGTQKKYDYWFTGANNSIINFEQSFDHLYYVTVNVNEGNPGVTATSDYREQQKKIFAANSPESNQYNPGNTAEPSANAADRLYSPSDQGRLNMTIVGDPAWIAQGDVWSGINGPAVLDPAAVAFLPDGTINYERQEALFEVGFNKPEDYDLDTGLMPIKRAQ